MKHLVAGILLGTSMAGCGAGVRAAPPRSDGDNAPRGTAVTAASVALSAHTHHGADALEGLRISGRCATGRVWTIVGHDPPYEPLRPTGVASIDRTRPPEHVRLVATCRGGRFRVSARQLAVRWSTSALKARASTERGGGLTVAARQYAME